MVFAFLHLFDLHIYPLMTQLSLDVHELRLRTERIVDPPISKRFLSPAYQVSCSNFACWYRGVFPCCLVVFWCKWNNNKRHSGFASSELPCICDHVSTAHCQFGWQPQTAWCLVFLTCCCHGFAGLRAVRVRCHAHGVRCGTTGHVGVLDKDVSQHVRIGTSYHEWRSSSAG